MAPRTTFSLGLKIAAEASRCLAPGASHWHQGGRWMDVITEGRPSLENQQAIIFPAGHAGKRSMNQQQPVAGRQWSGGDFSANVTADFIGQLLHAAMGAASHNAVPSTDHELLTDEPLAEGSKSLVLTAQPSDGGAILEFIVTGTSNGGTIAVSGIDAHGNGASETLTFASAGSLYTRTSFSAVGASSITVNSPSPNDGSISIRGYQYFEHIFSASDNNPTYAIERVGDPTAGAASRSHMHLGMVLQSLTFNTPAAARDGVFTVDSTWEGDPTATCDATMVNDASPMRIWPAWTLNVSRDGQNWHQVINQSFTINSGNRNYRAAAGTQNPQGSFFGARELTGSNDILVENEIEYERWRGASKSALVYTWNSPWQLTSSQNMSLTASFLDAFVETNSGGEDDGAQTLSQDFRVIASADADVGKFILINGVPGQAYSHDYSM